MSQRVQKILSQWGIASRRQAEKMITAGRVSLNGKTIDLGTKADPQQDIIAIDGQPLQPESRPSLVYLLLNKPPGVLSTCFDPQNRPTVLDLLPPTLSQAQGIHPVGRLDLASTGALLLTNDGELTLKLTHPRYHLPKTYLVWVKGYPQPQTLKKWRNGVNLEGKKTLPAQVEMIQKLPEKTLLKIVLQEGRNRQIRKMAQMLDHPVISLHRTAIGPIHLNRDKKQVTRGKYRFLEAKEIQDLKKVCANFLLK